MTIDFEDIEGIKMKKHGSITKYSNYTGIFTNSINHKGGIYKVPFIFMTRVPYGI